VYQDVRGRWMSDGLYDNMRAYIPNKKSKRMLMKLQIRMILLIGWLKIQTITMGMLEFGEFHTPGFMLLLILIKHPALKAVSPQACISDFFL
jgi:hypothetical protein